MKFFTKFLVVKYSVCSTRRSGVERIPVGQKVGPSYLLEQDIGSGLSEFHPVSGGKWVLNFVQRRYLHLQIVLL